MTHTQKLCQGGPTYFLRSRIYQLIKSLSRLFRGQSQYEGLTILSNRKLYAGYLNGRGIEIGAMHAPVEVDPERAKVIYVDRLPTDELKRTYPDIDGIVDVGLISGAEDLSAIADGSLDFIVANHVVEHLVNPLRSIEFWRQKLRDSGILYMAFPGAAFCPDRTRPVTSIEHLLEDYRGDVNHTIDEHVLSFLLAWNPGLFPEPEALGHFLESMRARDEGCWTVDARLEASLGANREAVTGLLRDNRPKEIHQHVFTFDSMKAVLAAARNEFGLRFRLLDLSLTKGCLSEYIFVLEAITTDAETEGFISPQAKMAERLERFYESWYAKIAKRQNKFFVTT